jgi:DTW domain-containing protein YfiP
VTGEAFDPDELAALLYAGGRSPVLFYPASDSAPGDWSSPSKLRLVVLDGTWRKSRKMLHLNPLLHTLPRLALEGMPESHYRIRKAHAPDQLSSMEAAVYALMRLEGNEAPFVSLLSAFDGFVDQQASYAQWGQVRRT